MSLPSVLVVTSSRDECNFAKDSMSRFKDSFHSKCIFVGTGTINAASALSLELSAKNYDLVLVTGFCGGTQDFSVGQLVNPTCVKSLSSLNGLEFQLDFPPASNLPLLSTSEKPECIYTTGFWVNSSMGVKSGLFDMETLAVAQVADEFGVPCTCIKLVTNIVTDEDNLEDHLSAYTYLVNFDSISYHLLDLIKTKL